MNYSGRNSLTHNAFSGFSLCSGAKFCMLFCQVESEKFLKLFAHSLFTSSSDANHKNRVKRHYHSLERKKEKNNLNNPNKNFRCDSIAS